MRRSTKTLLALACGMSLAAAGRADTFTFNDTTETLTITQVGSSRNAGGGPGTPLLACGGEQCTGPIFSNNYGVVIPVSTTIPQTLWIGDPVSGMISDVLQVDVGQTPGSPGFFYAFFSDDESGVLGPRGSFGGPCSATAIGNCQITEDGTIQLAGTVTWSDGSVDTFWFASDVEGVPEPSTDLLLMATLLALAYRQRRRLGVRVRAGWLPEEGR